MSDAENPYAAPKAPVADPASTDAERIRKEHVKHEASVQSAGCLYYLSGAGLAMYALAMFALIFVGPEAGEEQLATGAVAGGMSLAFAAMSAAFIAVGRGLRRLRGWVKVPVGILSGLGLLGFPMGTLINGYILYLVFSGKGSTVLSPEYQEVVRQTPHVKYRTPVVVWIFLGLLVAVIGFVAVMAILDS